MRRPSAALPTALALAACAAPEAASDASPASALALSGVRHESFRDGRLLARARIDSLVLDRASGRVEAAGVTLADGASPEVTLTARSAQGSTKGAEARLAGGVVLTGSAGERLETEHCTLDLDRDTATGRDPVTIATPDLAAKADGFSAALGAAPLLRLEGRVRASSRVKEPSPPVKPVRSRR